MNIKKISLFLMLFIFQIHISYTAAGEKKEADRVGQISFRDEVINLFKTGYRPLRQGFDLIGLSYDDFLETQRDLIPEDEDSDSEYDGFMHKIVTNAENIIIERMQATLEQGFRQAIQKHTDLD